MTVSRTLAQFLVSTGHGTGFADLLPDSPDDCFTVNEYPGGGPVWEHGSVNPAIEQPHVQLVVRGGADNVLATRQRAEAAHRELIRITNRDIGGIHFLAVRHLQDGWMPARDESRRFKLSRNYRVQMVSAQVPVD